MLVRERIRNVFSGSRALVRLVYRDPEHVSERLTLFATERLGEDSQEWADAVREERPDEHRAVIAEELRARSANIARIDGAISGTPFFLALVPGYVTFLWQEARMSLRTAALYGRDPRALRTAAEVLALRGVHPSVEEAEAALVTVRDQPVPEKPAARRPLVTWYRSGYALLVFGGFLSPPSNERVTGLRARLIAFVGLVVAGIVWAITWILPLTFMIVMAWACESHTRQLGQRALVLFGGEAQTTRAAIDLARGRHDAGHEKRKWLRRSALALSVILPLLFVGYAIRVRNDVGVTWVVALGSLVAFSLVVATAVVGSRR